jgi:4-hydroxy-tetrahydrodipicolinate synthase
MMSLYWESEGIKMTDFGRVLTAMVTPFDANQAVDYQAAQEIAVKLIDSGSDGVVIAGTTGESPTLSKTEKPALFQAVVEAVKGRGSVIAGTGTYNTAESVELTQEAEKTGVDGFLLVTPYYNKPPQEGLYQHFKAIAAATRLPVILYNIPGRTCININPDTMARLAAIPNIVAVKECNLAQVAEVRAKAGPDFLIYSGDDCLTLPMMSIGGHGVISVAGHIAGRRIHAMIDAFLAGAIAEASKINTELEALFRTLFITTNPIMVKAACNMLGMKAGGVRLPLVEATEKERAAMREVLEKMGMSCQ